MIIAAVNVAVHIPTTRGSSPAGDTKGGIERCAGAIIASTEPSNVAIANSGHTLVLSDTVYATSSAAHNARPSMKIATTRRRSNRSATMPLTRTRTNEGRNWARPISPMSSGSPVRSYTCLNRPVTSSIWAPLDSVVESRYRRTDAYLNTSTAPATSRHGSRGC